jgi:hypothetical protein
MGTVEINLPDSDVVFALITVGKYSRIHLWLSIYPDEIEVEIFFGYQACWLNNFAFPVRET